jgi:hypothetical protein
MTGQQTLAELFQIVFAMEAEDIRQLNHGTGPVTARP